MPGISMERAAGSRVSVAAAMVVAPRPPLQTTLARARSLSSMPRGGIFASWRFSLELVSHLLEPGAAGEGLCNNEPALGDLQRQCRQGARGRPADHLGRF